MARLPVYIPSDTLARMEEAIARSGYSQRSRSRWIWEAIQYLAGLPDDGLPGLQLGAGDQVDRSPKVLMEVSLTDARGGALATLVYRLRRSTPFITWNTSTTIRAAIRFRLNAANDRLIREAGKRVT